MIKWALRWDSKVALKGYRAIHRQLDTKAKLFCGCPTDERSSDGAIKFVRYLREAQSELGTVDPAAAFEAKRARKVVYHADPANSCMVEMDEEPPHPLNQEAVEIALTIAMMLNSQIVDEIHVMRKIVIDGSNTTGFQRTCVIATGGHINVDGEEYGIQSITLEEDAAKLLEVKSKEVHYDLSRLGIPLIEISTAPTIKNPENVAKVALAIGRLLRSTGKVKRGIGTVRQDINISIKDGALIEIKGIQEPELISKVVENEVIRQLHLLEIKEELAKRGVKEEMLNVKPVNVTSLFSSTKSKIIRSNIEKGGKVLAVMLRGFGGLLSKEKVPGIRLGLELSYRARAWGDVQGVFHTDELPAYGISDEEVKKLKEVMKAREEDAVVLVASEEDKAREALNAVIERAKEALKGVPEETRSAKADGTTYYTRPRPGAARMYPETDIPPIPLSQPVLEKLRSNLPKSLDELVEELCVKYNLSKHLANSLIDGERLELFKEITSSYDVPASFVASSLTEMVTSLKRDGFNVASLKDEMFKEFFKLVSERKVAKEAVKDVFEWLCRNPDSSVHDAIKALNLSSLPLDYLEIRVRNLVRQNMDSILSNERKAIGMLMGKLMGEFRGRIDGKVVNDLLIKAIEEEKRRVETR